MPRFEYRATDPQGLTVSGVIEAANLELATDSLKDRGLIVISVVVARKRSALETDLPFFNRVGTKELVIFSRQFAVLMGSKVPVVSALRTALRQTKNKTLFTVLSDVADEVEAGTALSTAMSRHPRVFDDFFVNMIRSGETTGRLEEIMNYLAEQMERDYDLMTRIKGAMIYPIIVMFGLVVVGFVMMTFVVPKLTDVLRESGATLPWTTRSLIGVSDFMKSNFISIIIGITLTIGGFLYWIRTPNGKMLWDGWKMRLPVFGPLLQLIYVIRFTRSMSTLITGGVDIPAALEVTGEVVANARFREVILATRKEVMDGHSITTVFIHDTVLMPRMVSQMMSVGEESGRLAEVLEKMTDFYARELSNKVSNLVSAIEPIIMLIMGAAVGVMVAAIMMPMYQMATQF